MGHQPVEQITSTKSRGPHNQGIKEKTGLFLEGA